MPTHQSHDGQDALAELIASKVADKYFDYMKEYVATQIQMHSYQCAAAKWGWFKSFFSGITGGVIVGVIIWIIQKV